MVKQPQGRERVRRFVDCRPRVVVAGYPVVVSTRPIAFAEVDHHERDLPPIVVPAATPEG